MNIQSRNTNTQEALLEQLRRVDFALYETILYLDAYPENCDAMTLYRSLLQAKESLMGSYQRLAPLTAFGNTKTTWDWVKTPWPWEN